jgi:hypothetical protein
VTLQEQVSNLQAQLKRLIDKKDRLLWQHAEGLIGNDELRKACKATESSIKALADRRAQLMVIADQPESPDPASMVGLLGWVFQAINTKYQANEEQKTRIAEKFGLQVTVFPVEDAHLRLQIGAAIPMVINEVTVDHEGKSNAMVCPSLPRMLAPPVFQRSS